jgi:hypothetical protein
MNKEEIYPAFRRAASILENFVREEAALVVNSCNGKMTSAVMIVEGPATKELVDRINRIFDRWERQRARRANNVD